jgi:hypothetical protein
MSLRSITMMTFGLLLGAAPGIAQAQTLIPTKAYTEEWVYRIQYGHQEEWWTIFQKYQIAELDEMKRSGDVLNYTVYRANLHTDNAARWDFRIIVTFKDFATVPEVMSREEGILRKIFPDVQARKRDETRRWELTLNHWDLPIAEIDPHK